MSKVFMTTKWENLAMVTYEVDPEILRPHCPIGTEVDLYNGKAYVSLVGFQFKDTRIKGIKALFHQNFLELNLRFYVKGTVRETGETLHGVVFIKETASRFLASLTARLLFGEPFETKRMAHLLGRHGAAYSIFDKGDWRSMLVYADRHSTNYIRPKPDGLMSFLIDRKLAFAKKKWRRGTDVYVISRENKWRFVKGQAEVRGLEKLYGPEFVPFLSASPVNGVVIDGGEVSVSKRYTFIGRY